MFSYIVDAVLLQEGHESLVSKGRELTSSSSRSGFERLGKSLTSSLDRFSSDNIIKYIISLPLNAIPLVGTISFIFYNGELYLDLWVGRDWADLWFVS